MDPAARAELPLPSRAQFEPVGPKRAPALMSFEAFRALLDAQPGLAQLELQGAGEPLAHPRFFDMVALAAARGIAVATASSLLTISDARIEQCVASGLARLDLAPGAAQPSDCDYLRPGSKLRRGLANARRLAAARRRLGATRPRIRVVLVLLRSHLGRLAELLRLARAHGADALAFEHLWHDASPARRFVEAESLLRQEIDWKEIQALAGELGLALELPQSRGGRCELAWSALHVGASGEALPCPKAKTAQRLDLGNMRREGVVRVWNGEAYREFRRRLAAGDPPALCRSCTVYQA